MVAYTLKGNFKFSLGQFNLGMAGNYISSTGGFTYSDITGSVEENYEVSTIELLALLDIILGSQNSITKFFIQLSGGYGFASALHTANFKLYQDPSQNFDIEHDISGNYFAGRVKLGLQFQLQNIILEIASGYRIANAGVLKGDLTQNGIKYTNQPVNDISGNGIEFDLSGVLITAGISIQI
ncbi:MAG: hypothetical protein IPJ03_02775 [Ignavibacteriales bacterium]|nr:hypothetical protein [Ignavibacteriales bacterium]